MTDTKDKRIPENPGERMSEEEKKKLFGEPEFTRDAIYIDDKDKTRRMRIEREREAFGIESNEEALQKFFESFSTEQRNELRQILQQMPVSSEDTYIEQDIIPVAFVYLAKLQHAKHYSRRMNGNYDAIMADARAEIEKQDFDSFISWLERAKEHDIKPITEEAKELYGEGLLAEDAETAIDWLSERCRPFEYALSEYKLDTHELKRLIEDHVKQWFPKEKRRCRNMTQANCQRKY